MFTYLHALVLVRLHGGDALQLRADVLRQSTLDHCVCTGHRLKHNDMRIGTCSLMAQLSDWHVIGVHLMSSPQT